MRNLILLIALLFPSTLKADWDFFGHDAPVATVQYDAPLVMAQVIETQDEVQEPVVVVVQEYDVVCENGVCRRVLRDALSPILPQEYIPEIQLFPTQEMRSIFQDADYIVLQHRNVRLRDRLFSGRLRERFANRPKLFGNRRCR